ncbi:MAG: hypothetical protein ACP5NO_08670, partial [Thermoplasmata archaeon]
MTPDLKILVVSFGSISEIKNGYFNLVNESVKAMRKHYDIYSLEFVSKREFSELRELNDSNRFFVQIETGLEGGSWFSKIVTFFLNSLEMQNIIRKHDVIIIETSVF